MKNKAVFLDRDGTINKDSGYVYKIEDFEFLPGVVEALRILQENGYLLIVITNQSGIARGYYTEADFHKLNSYMLDQLAQEGIAITDVLYCPHLPNADVQCYRKNCNCRKPKTGLFEQAVEKWNIDLTQSYAVGDKERDLAICHISNCGGFLLSDTITAESESARILQVKDLCTAARNICGVSAKRELQ